MEKKETRHKSLSDIGTDIGKLCEEKNAAYGDSFAQAGEILRKLYPNGVSPDEYTDMLGIIRVIDKLFRIATHKDAFGESPWNDIAGYGILGAFNDQKDLDTFLNEELRRIEAKAEAHIQEHGLDLWPIVNPEILGTASDTISVDNSEESIPGERSCEKCKYQEMHPADMPCKKCIDKPYLPHFNPIT